MEVTYCCPVCGKVFTDLDEYIAHLNECNMKRKAAEEKVKKERLRAEKEARLEEVNKAYKEYKNLATKFAEDYGYYASSSDVSDPFSSILQRILWG